MWWWGNICFNPHTVPMLFVKDCGTVSTQKKIEKVLSGSQNYNFR